jgi:hypothetical protein
MQKAGDAAIVTDTISAIIDKVVKNRLWGLIR